MKCSSIKIEEPSFVLDYIFGDLSPKKEREFERWMQQDEDLQLFVEDVLFIAIQEDLSKQSLLQFFQKSKAAFMERFTGSNQP
ncbi:MAG: hypothetical protein IPN76_14175 [Saprospiraceae bacterium]|nr:hypothetical protein [Saprospiraceae bacterium]